MLLTHLGVAKSQWSLMLQDFGGAFPVADDELQQLVRRIRTHVHILERTQAGNRTLAEGWDRPFATKNVAREHY